MRMLWSRHSQSLLLEVVGKITSLVLRGLYSIFGVLVVFTKEVKSKIKVGGRGGRVERTRLALY